MPSPIKFAHVVLKTRKYQEMVAWWCDFLGGSVRHGDDFISFISYDDEHHRLAIAAIPGLEEPNPKAAGIEHFAFTFANIDDLFAQYETDCAHSVHPHRRGLHTRRGNRQPPSPEQSGSH